MRLAFSVVTLVKYYFSWQKYLLKLVEKTFI